MRSVIILAIAMLIGMQCSRKMHLSAPSCIEKKIMDIKAQTKWNPPAKVSEYEYNGNKVYLFSSPCCDQYNNLYDNNCNLICAPSGGLTGKGDSKCPEFEANAKFISVVWEDKR